MWENEYVSKMLSCDLRLALLTFVQLVCSTLPCGFISVRRARSFEGIHVNSFGQVIRAWVNDPVSRMLSSDLRLALHKFVQLVCPTLPCRFVSVVRAALQIHLGGSFEGVHVNSFGQVVQARARLSE